MVSIAFTIFYCFNSEISHLDAKNRSVNLFLNIEIYNAKAGFIALSENDACFIKFTLRQNVKSSFTQKR